MKHHQREPLDDAIKIKRLMPSIVPAPQKNPVGDSASAFAMFFVIPPSTDAVGEKPWYARNSPSSPRRMILSLGARSRVR